LRMVAITTKDERLEEVPPPFEVGEGFVGEAYENGEPVIYDEGVSEQDTPFDYSPVESAMLIPIEGHGMINLASLEERAFDEETRELARLFAADIESALERADREERLREREQELQEYETLVETVSDGVYMSNEDYEFSMVNEAFVDLLGYDSREELLGKVVPEITVSDQEYEKAVETRQQLIESDQQTVSVENEIECADGTTRQVETRFTLLPTDDGYRGTAGVVRDVSDRKERAALLKRLHEATRGLQTAETKQDVAERATEVADRLGFPTIAVRQEIDGELRVVAQATNIDSLEGRQMPAFEIGEGIVGGAYEGGEVCVYDDLQEAGMKYDPSPIRSAMFVPIGGYGMLSIASPKEGVFGEIEMELGRLFAADVESAIERADREEKLRAREQELQQQQSYTTDLLNAIEDVFYIMDDEGYLLQWNESFNEVTGYSDEEIEGMRGNVLFPEDERSRALESFYETLDSGQTRVETEFLTKDGTRIPHEFDTSRLEDPEGNTVVVGIARDITERKAREEKLRARERELQRQRDELETLNRINELIQGTIRSMASAATREEIETTVCERLAASPFYQFAWTGRRSAEDELVTPRTSAGDGESYLETVEIPVQQWDRLGPGALALKNGTVEVVDDIESDPRCEPWRETALEYGFRSVAVVPFRHGKTVHSILALYADRPAAFSDREQRAFEVLGDMVGFAISAIQHRRLIEAETVLELAIDLPDSETFFAEMARRLNCTCQLLGSVPSGDAMLHYVSVSGASADAADAYMNEAAADRVDDARVVRSTDDGCVIAVRVLNSTPELLQEAGARTVDIRVTPESTRVVTRAARDTDVRMLLDVFRDVHGEPVLDAKREVERDNYTDEAFRTDVADRLTDRQDAALSAAYFGGYFDWPRDSTAEEIADTLDISSATLHQHLRHAQHKLLEIYFDDTTARTGA
jgi:PAS domain S-box-containing protein